MKLRKLTITQAHKNLVDRKISAVELTKAFLTRIAEVDKEIAAFLSVFGDSAIFQAKKVDDQISKGRKISMLAGIPLAVKDNILIEGKKCTAASKILESYIAPYDATCIKKLKREGVIFLGKTNLDEFAMGSSTENSAFKITHNPQDLSRVPGGSSGGSAAAVKANESIAALGSDTGGSIRQPASLCGVVGLKPTYGAVSRYGLIAFASSLDQIGPITKNIQDAKIIFDVIAGRDPKDSTSVELNPKQVQNSRFKIKNLRIGVPKEYFIEGIDPKVEKVIRDFIQKIEREGAKIEEISLPHTKYALPCYFLITASEASANLARYDGIKYGKKSKNQNLIDEYLKTRGEGFGDEVKRRIMLGTYALSSGYYDAYYLRAQKVRTLIKKDFQDAFQKVDVILTPTSPFTAFKIGERAKSALSMYLADIFTASINLAGLPALSMPCGEIQNLPVGLQIIGKSFQENEIFEVASFFEKMMNY